MSQLKCFVLKAKAALSQKQTTEISTCRAVGLHCALNIYRDVSAVLKAGCGDDAGVQLPQSPELIQIPFVPGADKKRAVHHHLPAEQHV